MPPKAAPTRQPSARRAGGPEATPGSSAGAESTPTHASEARGTPAQSATPGPSGRPSVQRLQSLKKPRGGSGSITPSGRPPSGLGEPAKPKLKFQPKNVGRRSREEREALQKLEEERNNERLKEAAAIQRGRGGRGGRSAFRGRGGPAGMAGSGPLGSDTGLGGARRRRGGGGGGGPFGAGSVGRDRTRSAISSGSRPPVDEDSDEYESELRVDINDINDTESEDEHVEQKDIKGKLPYRPKGEKGLKPYRVHRIEHEERVVSVNMESSSSRSAELRKKAEEDKAAKEQNMAAPVEAEADEGPRVKKEPAEDQDTTMMDAVPPVEDDGFLPTQTVRVRRKVPESPQKVKATRKDPGVEAIPKRDPRELLRTKEEIEEYDRHLEDLEHVRNLLHHEEPQHATTEPQAEEPQTMETTEGEGATETRDEGEQQTEEKSTNPLLGQLFLMQFPPITPNLTIPGSSLPEQPAAEPTPAPQNEVKTESNDVQIVDADAPPSTETAKVITATTPWSLPAGRVGKLNVHKSGRVTMHWGGISFELDRAALVDFVQEALIVSEPAAEEPGQPAREEEGDYRAWSMGQLSGKFTVMPNWDQML